MVATVLDELLETLDVRLHAFAVLQVGRGYRLLFDPVDAVVIHYVLAGSGMLRAIPAFLSRRMGASSP